MKIRTSTASLRALVIVLTCSFPYALVAQDRVWTSRTPPDASSITGVAVDPNNPLVLYATSDAPAAGTSAIRKSVDGGRTWTRLAPGSPRLSLLTCLAVDPTDSSKLYVGSTQGFVGASRDGGASWVETAISGAELAPVSAIAVEAGSNRVYAATRPSGFYFFPTFGTAVSRSSDSGTTWQPTTLAAPRGAYALLADALPQWVLAGTDFAYPNGYYGVPIPQGGGIASSGDYGGSWALPQADLGYSVTALAKRPQGSTVYAATSAGQVLGSVDRGASWTALATLPGTVSALALDPGSTGTIYAALLHGGVWRSLDGGRSWRLFDSGLTDLSVRSLAIDATGRSLYAGTRAGVFHRDLPAYVGTPCSAAQDHLCFFGSRFRVELFAADPRTGAPAAVRALPRGDRFGYFSFPSLTSDAELPEVFVKMLDATSLPGQGFWFFSTALTNVPHSLVVTDTATGLIQIYDGQAFCGTADVDAFPQDFGGGSVRVRRTDSSAAATGAELALLSGRFRLTLEADDPRTGTPIAGVAIPQGDRFGYFSLPALTGDATFPEVFVKMLDARSLPDADFWLFQAGITGLPYRLTVTDTVSGASKMYRNDPSDPTRLCGSSDLRVTTEPVPADLTGDWSSAAFSDLTASVVHSGDRLQIRATRPDPNWSISFDGSLAAGSATGVMRRRWDGCHFENDAAGWAVSSQVRIGAESLEGTCGIFPGFLLDLTPVPEGGSADIGDR